jgi:hypothetical protein
MATINPFQGPINYAVDVQSPFEAAIGGFKLGAAGAEAQAQATARDRAAQAQKKLVELYANPFATAEDYDKVIAFLPKDQAALVSQGFERKTKEQQQNTLQQAGQVFTALKSGQPDVAKKLLTDQAAAYRKAGREQDAKATETYYQMIDINQPGAQTTIGLMIAALPGGKDLLENVDKTLSTQRAEALAPSELDKSQSLAKQEKTKAEVAAATSKADINKAIALASQEESKALVALETEMDEIAKAKALRRYEDAKAATEELKNEYARTNAILDVRQKGVQLGLTEAQIKQAEASIAASNAAAKKDGAEAARLEAQARQIADGIIPNEKRPEAERNFRNEYNDRTKGFQDTKAAYTKILAVSDPKTPDEEAPADIALIFNFMKMQDPSSTISTGEYANAQNAAGVADKVVNLYNNLLKGSKLSQTQRKAFRGQAENLYKAAGQQEDIVRKGIDRIAKGMGLNTENIFYTPTEVVPTAVSGAPAPSPNTVKVGDMTYIRPANFTDKQWSDYKQSVDAK